MDLTAKRRFHYARRILKPGDAFTAASMQDAKILLLGGFADVSEKATEAETEKLPKRLRGKKRRDDPQPEPVAEPIPVQLTTSPDGEIAQPDPEVPPAPAP